jgi:DNA polymerase I
MKKRLIIIDCNSIIHRAFHALPPLKNKKGEVVNALYGFLLVFFKILKEFNPDFVAACFDAPGPTFRHKEFKEYKAKRPKAPQELYDQMPKVKKALKSFNVSVFEKEGFEADDLIGTIARSFKKEDSSEVIILSGDADLFQLLKKGIKLYFLKRGVKNTVLYNVEKFKEDYSFSPDQMIEYKALRGDASDNIPGAPGIGEKTALEILKEFESIDNLFKNLEKKNNLKERIKKILKENKEKVFFSRHLAQIKSDVPIKIKVEDIKFNLKEEKAESYLREMGFHSLANRIFKKRDQKEQKNLKLW